jgi:hypothetical protein
VIFTTSDQNGVTAGVQPLLLCPIWVIYWRKLRSESCSFMWAPVETVCQYIEILCLKSIDGHETEKDI